MKSLVLRLAGPMQSWGTQSRFSNRDTGREPSKSGVIGLLCAAKGIDRNDDESLKPLAELAFGIRVDQDGLVCKEFQTAGGGSWNGNNYGVIKASGKGSGTVISNRYYLTNVVFHAALGSDDESLLHDLEEALANPHWPLYLGRKSYVPSMPLCLGVHDGAPASVLAEIPWRPIGKHDKAPKQLRIQVDSTPEDGIPRQDVPISFRKENRIFGVRYVKNEMVEDFPIESQNSLLQLVQKEA